MAAKDRYGNRSALVRARRRFGETYVDLAISSHGIDVDDLERWCIRTFGEKWRGWTSAPYWHVSENLRRDYVRFFFATSDMRERFRSFWLSRF